MPEDRNDRRGGPRRAPHDRPARPVGAGQDTTGRAAERVSSSAASETPRSASADTVRGVPPTEGARRSGKATDPRKPPSVSRQPERDGGNTTREAAGRDKRRPTSSGDERPADTRPTTRGSDGKAGSPSTEVQEAGEGAEPPGRRSRHRAFRPRWNLAWWQELPLLLLFAFILAVLVRTFLIQAFYIPSGSMEDTLQVGDRVLVNKIVYQFRDPERGEIVVFRGTDRWAPEHQSSDGGGAFREILRTVGDLIGLSQPSESDFIKRVIGLPGDTVECCDEAGRVMVNGEPLEEDYILTDSPLDVPSGANSCASRRFGPLVVPEGHLFVLGDHRLVSQDSRCQGTVPIDNVIGRADLIIWPMDRWGTFGLPDTFADVPQAIALGATAPFPLPQFGLVVGVVALVGLRRSTHYCGRFSRIAFRRRRLTQ